MMKKPSDFFHGEKNYNCAQSVLACFQDEFQLSDEKIQSLQSFGGGRAPEGRCGALHAALELVEDPIRKAALIRDFINEAGAPDCRTLKTVLHYPCAACVDMAAELVKKYTAE